METFQIGDQVELRAFASMTLGVVVAVDRDAVRITWQHGIGMAGKTTTERPQDLQKRSR
jgi:hypothetical protein